MPDVRVAGYSGFCFGVKNAAGKVSEYLSKKKENERFFTLGKLIHNDSYVADLESKGVFAVGEDEIDGLAKSADSKSPVTIFLRAHGVPKPVAEKLARASEENEFFKYVDCTCPYVKKIHKIAEKNSSPENIFILMGQASHPEVAGIMSYVSDNGFVFDSADALERGLRNNACGEYAVMAAQTTFDVKEWARSQEIFKKLYTKGNIFDTICRVTELRQSEADKMSRECDVMIAIGGRESSNTAKLFNICAKNCKESFLAENAEQLRDIMPRIKKYGSHAKVGIVAGASTPSDIIREVFQTMSEDTENRNDNFEELLESSLTTLNSGDTVTGTITSVSDTELQLDIGAKVTGRIPADQATENPNCSLKDLFKVGDQIEAFVIKVSDVDGFATLSKRRADADKNWKLLVNAKKNRDILEGTVTGINKGGVEVRYNSNRVFIPASQSGISKTGDLNTLKNTDVRFRIIEVKDRGRRAIGSISSVLREARYEEEKKFWDTIEVGMHFNGRVKKLTSYGAFVNLGVTDGMLHNSEISWKHIKSPDEVIAVDDVLDVFVKSFDREKRRISLGYKTEESNPWHVFMENYSLGDIICAKIVNITSFGAFAEIVDGVDGLIHISQLSTSRVVKPDDVVSVGDIVDVKIIGIEEDTKKVSLSIKEALHEMPDAADDGMSRQSSRKSKKKDRRERIKTEPLPEDEPEEKTEAEETPEIKPEPEETAHDSDKAE